MLKKTALFSDIGFPYSQKIVQTIFVYMFGVKKTLEDYFVFHFIYLHLSAFHCIPLHFSAFLSIFLHFSAFHCIPLNFPAFLCISHYFSLFLSISLHLSAFFCTSLLFSAFFHNFSAFYILDFRTIVRSVPSSYGHHFFVLIFIIFG